MDITIITVAVEEHYTIKDYCCVTAVSYTVSRAIRYAPAAARTRYLYLLSVKCVISALFRQAVSGIISAIMGG